MSAGDPFRRRTAHWLLAIGAASLVAAVLLVVFGDDLGEPPAAAGPSTFSRSAIGHRAFLETLRQLGVPVTVSQAHSGAKAGESAVLLVIEPSDAPESLLELRTMLGDASYALVVLPKWTGTPRTDRPGWLGEAELLPTTAVAEVVNAMLAGPEGEGAEAPADPAIIVRSDVGCAASSDRAAPVLRRPQLLATGTFDTVLGCGDHVLVGSMESDDGVIYVLSDPDLLSNHGLGEGQNAAIAIDLLDELRDGNRAVIIDEAIHGYRGDASLARELFRYPLVLATLQGLVALIALLLAATVRFGAPVPAAPPLAAGKALLIDNIASLLHTGGHAGHTLIRYLDTAMRDVARSLHAPPDLDDDALRGWLGRVGEARGVSIRLADLDAEVTAAAAQRRRRLPRVAVAAERVHRWKQEMLRGAV